MSLNFITAWRTINDTTHRVLIWCFTSVLIKINYGQIGDQTGLVYTTNPVFYTSGNRFVRRTGVIEPFSPIVSFPPEKWLGEKLL
jgi:hypothetical protein